MDHSHRDAVVLEHSHYEGSMSIGEVKVPDQSTVPDSDVL